MNGFVDLHTHGIGAYDTRTHDPRDILKISHSHGRAGTRVILPTIYAAGIPVMRRQMEAVRKAMQIQNPLTAAGRQRAQPRCDSASQRRRPAVIAGVHLEGPFLNPSRSGSLAKEAFLRATISNLERLIEGYEDMIKIMTLAPEIPGALKIIERSRQSGIKIHMGHSDASFGEALRGKEAGATGITHIFNAMRPLHHREPGIAGLGLLDEDLYIEVIADGFHIHPKILNMIFHLKAEDRIIVVSDSVRGPRRKGKPFVDRRGRLTGSGITVADAVSVLRNAGISDKLIARAAVENPAAYLGLKQNFALPAG